jgi:hypothetical protein
MKSDSRLKTALLYSPLLLCAGIMLPRLSSPQFGFFDDGLSLLIARNILAGQWSLGTDPVGGRFRPIYWLYLTISYRVFGANPFWFFIGNLVLWLGITFCLIQLARRLGMDRKASWFVGFTFAISGPVLENIYTLSKPELLQSVWILLLLLACSYYPRARAVVWKTGMVLLMAVLTLLAAMTKETGIVLAPAASASLAITWLWYRRAGQPGDPAVKQRKALWWGSFIGVLIYSILFLISLHWDLAGTGSGSLNFSLHWMIQQVRLLWSWFRRDYLYLFPIGLASVLIIFRHPDRKRLPLLLEGLVWLALWMAVYIPWKYIPEYYLLPAALIAALLSGLLFSWVEKFLHGPSFSRILAWGALGLSGLLLLLTLPSQIGNGRMQLAMDKANAEMLAYVIKYAPHGGTVWINIAPPDEYVTQFSIMVTQIDGRPDLQVDYFHQQDLANTQEHIRDLWIVSPFMENQFYPSVRVGMSELPSRQWNDSLDQYLAGRGDTLDEIRQSFTSSNFDPLRFFCPLTRSLSFCKVPDSPLDRRVFAYGWRVIRIP